MATSDVHGHRVPTGSDFAARKSLTDLSLSIMGGPKSVGSLAAANLYVTDVTAALSAAGLSPISADNPVYVSRADLGGALYRHNGATWLPVLGYDSGWVDIWTSGSEFVRARVTDRTLWVRASKTATGSGWTCPNLLPAEMRPTWTSNYVYALITEGSGTNSIAKMGARADGSLWFRSYGSATNIDGISSVPL